MPFASWDEMFKALHNLQNPDFNDEEFERAIEAAHAVDEMAKAEHVPQLYQLLDEGDYSFLAEVAAFPLARLEGMRALPALLKTLREAFQTGHDGDGLQTAIIDLVEAHREEALGYLLSLVHSPDADTRQNSAWLLGFLHPHVEGEILAKLAEDEDDAVRSAAISSLTGFDGQNWAFEKLVKALQDSSSQVRVSAASALGYFGDKRAIPFLRQALNDVDAKVQRFAQSSIDALEKRSEG